MFRKSALDSNHFLRFVRSLLLSQNFVLSVTCTSTRAVEICFAGIEVPVVNSIRRALLAEVPTMCIEDVFVMNNSSIVQDEVFAHRLGLLPLNADPSVFTCREGRFFL